MRPIIKSLVGGDGAVATALVPPTATATATAKQGSGGNSNNWRDKYVMKAAGWQVNVCVGEPGWQVNVCVGDLVVNGDCAVEGRRGPLMEY